MMILIKPTQKNKLMLQKRGLFSDDCQSIFDIYDAILSDKAIKLIFGFSNYDESRLNYIASELMAAGIEF